MWATHRKFCARPQSKSHHIFSNDQQGVSDVVHFILWKTVWSHLFLWPECQWHCTCCEGNLITSIHMSNRKWVTLHMLWNTVSSHLSPWPTGSEWHWTFVKGCHILWPTASEWHWTFFIITFPPSDQQNVSNFAPVVKGSLITPCPVTNSEWVTLHILWKAVLSHLFQQPTESEWHCTFCEMKFHHIFFYNQQLVSEIAHFMKGSLITSFLITNSMWVRLYILWKAVSSCLFLWPTACEWDCTFYKRQSHHIISHDQQGVSEIAQFMIGSLITSFPMNNRQ